MKLERISAAAQIELPNAKPLNRSHSVSKISAPMPEKKRITQKTATRPLWGPTACDVCLARDTWEFCELVTIAQRSTRLQQRCAGKSCKNGTSDNASLRCVNHSR